METARKTTEPAALRVQLWHGCGSAETTSTRDACTRQECGGMVGTLPIVNVDEVVLSSYCRSQALFIKYPHFCR